MSIGPAQTRLRACRSGSSISSRWSSAACSSACWLRARAAPGCHPGGTSGRTCQRARCRPWPRRGAARSPTSLPGCAAVAASGRGTRTGRRCPAPSWRMAAVCRGFAPACRHAGCNGGKIPTSCQGWSVRPGRLRQPRQWACCCRGRRLPTLHRRHRTSCLPRPSPHGRQRSGGGSLPVPLQDRRPGRPVFVAINLLRPTNGASPWPAPPY